MGLAVIAIGIGAAIAILLAVRAWRPPVRMSDHPRNKAPDPGNRLHRQAVHYRASGVLPRWDP
jgi:hypothetical protein